MVKKRLIYTVAVTIIVVFSTTFAILMTLERTDYRNYLQAGYSKNMYELINAISNIEDNLSKSVIVGTKEQAIIIFEDTFRNASKADDSLHSLPISQERINETSKFLSQVGDYSFTIVKSISQGGNVTDEDINNIENLKQQSYQLREDLNAILVDINEGRLKWGEIRQKLSGVLQKEGESIVENKFTTIQKQVSQYPSLIYDGPFSDNILEIEPKVNQMEEVSEDKAKQVVVDAVGSDKIESINIKNKEEQGKIESFSFEVKLKGASDGENLVCEVSKRGGKIVYLINNRTLKMPSIDQNAAIESGRVFLENMGYKSMVPTYYAAYEDSIVVNYVYTKGDVYIYPDQIKLKIAMDDGSIIGIESEKYLTAHTEGRVIGSVKISKEKAMEKVSDRLEITNTRLAIIPTETNGEALCYEFKGTYNGDSFIVYINAENGEPQRILKIINTPNGQLTI